MERRTQVLLGLVIALGLAVTGALSVILVPGGPTLAETWVSEPPPEAGGNHHAPAVGMVDGQALVFVPISSPRRGPGCQLVALEADTGEARWHRDVPPADCTVHAVADPTVTEWNGRPSVIVTTTENALFVLEPATGDVRDRYDLASYGYTRPEVVDLATGSGSELLVADARGTVQVIGTDGAPVWERSFGAYVWAQPVVDDLSGDGEPQVVLGTSDGQLVFLDRDGTTVRSVDDPFDGSITWLTPGQLDDDRAVELVVATASGQVVAVDGATGAVEWTKRFDRFAAVGAVGDGNSDGANEVYVTAVDGVVRALAGNTGETEWDRAVATADVQMMPPPVLGDVTGDGSLELVVASHDGRVVALDPASGTLIAEYERDGSGFVSPRLADVDDDRALEIFVSYADGAVVRLDYEA